MKGIKLRMVIKILKIRELNKMIKSTLKQQFRTLLL